MLLFHTKDCFASSCKLISIKGQCLSCGLAVWLGPHGSAMRIVPFGWPASARLFTAERACALTILGWLQDASH